MREQLKPALLMLLWLTLLTGVAYPLLVTGVAQLAFPKQANGSLIMSDGQVRGSALIGQPFSDPGYFWPRPSATAPFSYNAGASSGSNLGPLNPALQESVRQRVAALGGGHPPVDLVTASGSGLDPDISPAAAEFQIARVAAARGLDEQVLRQLVQEHTKGRQLGFLGEPRVNVLQLNFALDARTQGAGQS